MAIAKKRGDMLFSALRTNSGARELSLARTRLSLNDLVERKKWSLHFAVVAALDFSGYYRSCVGVSVALTDGAAGPIRLDLPTPP